MKNIWILCLSTLLLTGCINREQTDAKLARACAAGAEAFMEDGTSIKEIKKQTFGNSAEFGNGYREVHVAAVESDGWYETDKEYTCVFIENIGPFGLSYEADIHQLKLDDQIYGQSENTLMGTMDELNKLSSAVSKALLQ